MSEEKEGRVLRGCGELEGDKGRFSGREAALLSVSAETVELDIRRVG